MRVRPEVVLRRVEGVRLEGDAFAVANTERLKQHAAAFEEMATGTRRANAVVETGNDARIDVGTWNSIVSLETFYQRYDSFKYNSECKIMRSNVD